MKSSAFVVTAFVASLTITLPVRAENLEHTRTLLATKQCAGCDLSNAGLVYADLANANLRGANLQGANLSRANLVGADLTGANLTAATLYGANLTGARLDNANLTVTDLRDTYLSGVSFAGALMNNVQLQGAIDLPLTTGKAEEFYQWGIADGQRKNYPGAIENLTQAINRQPAFAEAYMARASARLQTGDLNGAIADTEQAEKLFTTQGKTEAALNAQKVAKVLKTPPEEPKARGNLGNALVGILGIALRFFLPF